MPRLSVQQQRDRKRGEKYLAEHGWTKTEIRRYSDKIKVEVGAREREKARRKKAKRK